MTAIEQRFSELHAQGGKAFVPFVTAGDPDLETTRQALLMLDRAGATVCELGIPYSDPIADGPVIQASYTRALGKQIRLAAILEMVQKTAPQMQSPVVLMVSYAIILRTQPRRFLELAQQSHVAGLIVPDLPLEESHALGDLCAEHGLSFIQLVTPTTPRDRARKIARQSTGFLYYVSIAGITGERAELPAQLLEDLRWLKGQTSLPICVGFGISQPEHAKQLAGVADGVIVGSAIVRRLAEMRDRGAETVLAETEQFARSLVTAMSGR